MSALRSTGLVFAVLLLATTACQRDAERPPNVLLVVVDTLRADRLGAYGNPRGLTPFLDELAGRGAVFTRAYAASSWTCPSVASLLTSRYPSQHHMTGFGSRLADKEVTLAERLRESRYIAGGFSANFRLLERLGYAQGFQHWQSDADKAAGLSGEALRHQSLPWLDQAGQASPRQPVLLYLHYMEPHSPYTPPEPFRSRFVRNDDGSEIDSAAALDNLKAKLTAEKPPTIMPEDVLLFERQYDAEVATVDAEIRTLFTELEQRRFLDDAIVVVTADHGEEFAEHGGSAHGRTLYNESVHVPLILIAPGVPAGQRIEQNVSLVDLAPTILELVGLPSEPRFEGRSLTPMLHNTRASSAAKALAGEGDDIGTSADLILQLLPIRRGPDEREHEHAIIRRSDKLLVRRDGATETYDLATDPGERSANPPALEEAGKALAGALEETRRSLRARAGARMEPETLDEATKEKLRALGYQP